MTDWQQDPEAWKNGNEELLNEYEKKLQKDYDARLAAELDRKLEESLAKQGIKPEAGGRSQHWILDENNQVVKATYGEWCVWFERNPTRHVADDVFDFKTWNVPQELEFSDGKKVEVNSPRYSGYRVSTVFLGLDHNFSPKGPPLLFETMIFTDDKELENSQWRYATWKEAEKGHARAVQMVKRRMEKLNAKGTGKVRPNIDES